MNFELPAFDNKDVVFVGRGLEGKSFEKFIKQHESVKSFRFVDQKDDPQYLEKLKKLNLDQNIIVKTPGCPGYVMPVPYTTPTRVFFDCVRQLGVKTVGITGTKGKTTTASLLAYILQEAGLDARLAGNVGSPMLDHLEDVTSNTVIVVELSSHQLAELEASPDVAVITNLFKDHVPYHGSEQAYYEAKHNIVRTMGKNNYVIYNPDTKPVMEWLKTLSVHKMPISPQESIDMSRSKLFGEHNKLNYLMARSAAQLFGVDRASCQAALNSFEPVRHRLQFVRKVKGITFVDDAIGSTPEATMAGIEALIRSKGPVGCILLGGVDRHYDYKKLAQFLYRIGIPKLILFPDTGGLIKAELDPAYKPDMFETKSMQEAVEWAAENTPTGSICLLSTAAPSTVLWKNFEEKGDEFQKFVTTLTLPNY